MTGDTAAAAAFYSRVVGWHTMPSAADPTYTQFGLGGGYYAGMMKLPEDARAAGAKPQWLPYIGVADVEASAAAAERQGGYVKKPGADIPTIGRFAILSDPQGATFAIFKPVQAGMGAPSEAPLGSFAWLELATTNNEAAFDFYSKLFGWQAMQRMDMGPQGTYLIFGADGVQRGGMYHMNQERSSTPYWLPYASVASADVAGAAATAAGGRIVVGPMDVPGGGRIVQFMDPSGALFAAHSAGKPAAKPAAAPKPAPPKPAAPKPAAASPTATPSASAAKPAAPRPAAAKPAAPKPAAAPKKAAARKSAKKKPAAKKKATPKRKSAKKKVARKSAARSARKPARKAAAKKRSAKRRPAKKRGGKARRKK
jgi:hypothetical protein